MTDTATSADPARNLGAHPDTLLEVDGLRVEFRTDSGVVNAVNGVTYDVRKGETVAILGESGSGKSVSAQAIMGIIDSPPGFVTAGELRYRGEDLLQMSDKARQEIRGAKISMIFQDALSSLNPVFSIGWQLSEMYRVHEGMAKDEARTRSIDLLQRVGIPSPEQRVDNYPHEFSGGMRQRAMIAMAIALNPEIVIADEPTTALDVTVQAQIMELLADLQQDYGMAMVLITHDLGVVAEVADRVNVMYAGRIVEHGSALEVFGQPAHPYTIGLMESIPRADLKGVQLTPIVGAPPDLANLPSGCSFHPRCRFRHTNCFEERPPVVDVPGEGRYAECLYVDEAMEAEVRV
ncbi:ABC transporter ATP-binding protein [Euzebya tangerina]|uniref:ABC transporter ATP-binding protein n=1 Tax=Euzebya tangerina TaxID=591198 RepID=UPI000E322EE4|nr:ABC transporter ATP-binding protein [Euzebya tangerina]